MDEGRGVLGFPVGDMEDAASDPVSPVFVLFLHLLYCCWSWAHIEWSIL